MLINFCRKSKSLSRIRKEFIHKINNTITQKKSNKSSNKRNHNRFNQKLHNNIFIESANRFSNSNFSGSFRNRNDHNIHYSNSSYEKRNRPHRQKEHFHSLEGFFHFFLLLCKTRNVESSIR